jgi:hypothetical protein
LLANGSNAAPTTQPADVEKENAALKERVAALEARVKHLERQLRDRTATVPFRVQPMPAPEATRPFPEMPGIQIQPRAPIAPREGWQERDINGIRFYLVPLKAGESR